MRKLVFVFVVLCIMVACCLPLAAQDIKAAEEKINELQKSIPTYLNSWRYKADRVPNGQDPALDDSDWKVNNSNSFMWGNEPEAWLRTKVVVPEEIAGIKMAGSKLVIKVAIDDEGVLFVNGEKARSFRWDEGTYTLTEKAEPGQVFNIAIQGINGPGPGGLLFGRLEYSALGDLIDTVEKFQYEYRVARDTLNMVSPEMRKQYSPILLEAMSLMDLDAYKNGKRDEFITSIKAATAKLGGVWGATKDITINLAGHAHIDMNWLWLWPETVDVCKNTFTTICKLMEEYPGFTFSQSQPATYLAMEQYHPEVIDLIKAKIKTGQWEAIGTSWTEVDTNMSSGESLVRGIMYGKRYMMQKFGVDTNVGWAPDTFGHVWTLPQILNKCGIENYYFSRCGKDLPIFWWEGPDGSRVLAYNHSSYGGDIQKSMSNDAMVLNGIGLKNYMKVYGVGDHGGGPTRKMLDEAVRLEALTDYPEVKYTKVTDYFETALKEKQDYTVWNDELNNTFEGCYTTHGDIKFMNRNSENMIPCAEKFAVLASEYRVKYPTDDFVDVWRTTCFNQFHDILCGSAIHGSYDYSKELYDKAISTTNTVLNTSLDAITKRIATDKVNGTPIVVFNQLLWPRTDAVELASPFAAEAANVTITDEAGKSYPGICEDGKLCFTATDVPAMGYKVFWANAAASPMASALKADGSTIENQYFKVTVDPKQGVITSIYDKVNRKEIVPTGKSALYQVLMEKPHGMSAWSIGPIAETIDLTSDNPAAVGKATSAMASLSFNQKYDKSSITTKVVLYDNVPRIDLKITADWQQKGSGEINSPMLKLAFPVNVKNTKATYDIPFGTIDRKIEGAEEPALKWVDLSGGGYGVSLLNNCKYGFDVKDNVIRATLLRSSYDPDPIPDLGTHNMTFSLYPHKGDWMTAGSNRKGFELNEPLIARAVTAHSGFLPASASYASLTAPNVVATALKKAEDDDSLIIRFYESEGKACTTTVNVNLPVKSYVETDLLENPTGPEMPIKNGAFTVKVAKHEIKTYKLLRK